MKNKKNIWEELQDKPHKVPFQVPEDYFETFEDQLEAKLRAVDEPISPKGKIIQMLKPVLGMAASFALIFLFVYYPLSVFLPDYLAKNGAKPTDQTQTLSDEDLLYDYLSSSEQSIYDLLSGDPEVPTAEVSSDEILSYLSAEMNETEIFAELK
ncbi:hypothetical protein ACRTDU_17315 [Sunxiuqinia elliptica]